MKRPCPESCRRKPRQSWRKCSRSRSCVNDQARARRRPSGQRQVAGGAVSQRSVEAETLVAHEGAEVGAQRLRILPRLVLGPAVERGFAEASRIALAPVRKLLGAAAV